MRGYKILCTILYLILSRQWLRIQCLRSVTTSCNQIRPYFKTDRDVLELHVHVIKFGVKFSSLIFSHGLFSALIFTRIMLLLITCPNAGVPRARDKVGSPLRAPQKNAQTIAWRHVSTDWSSRIRLTNTKTWVTIWSSHIMTKLATFFLITDILPKLGRCRRKASFYWKPRVKQPTRIVEINRKRGYWFMM